MMKQSKKLSIQYTLIKLNLARKKHKTKFLINQKYSFRNAINLWFYTHLSKLRFHRPLYVQGISIFLLLFFVLFSFWSYSKFRCLPQIQRAHTLLSSSSDFTFLFFFITLICFFFVYLLFTLKSSPKKIFLYE